LLSLKRHWPSERGAEVCRGRATFFFIFYIILFSICQKYMPIFLLLQKCHPTASLSSGTLLPPDKLVEGVTAG